MKQPSAKSKKRRKKGGGVKKCAESDCREATKRKREKINSKQKEIRAGARVSFSCLALEGVFFSSRPRELFSALIVHASPLKWLAN